MERYLFRSYTFWLCVCAGLGGIAPDIGHLLNFITQGQVNWNSGHSLNFWVWWAIASFIGLGTISVLRKGVKYENARS